MKKDKNPNYIRIGIFTIVTALCWIFFSVYRTLTSKPAPTLSAQILAPFSPTLDIAKIDEIQGRLFFEEGQTQLIISQSPLPSPTPEATVEPTPASTPTTEPVVTEGTEESTVSGEVVE